VSVELAHGYTHPAVAEFAAVLDGDEFRTELERLSRDWGWGAPQETRAEAKKAHKGRCTFELTVRTASGWHAVIAKVHSVERSDQFHLIEALGRAGFGPDDVFSMPRPLAYLSSLHILMEEKVPGSAAKDVFLNRPRDEHPAAADRCGEWLARFHAAAPRLRPATDVVEEFPRFRRWVGQLAPFGRALAPKSAELCRALEAAAPTTGTDHYRAAHGSYIPEHVLLGDGRTSTIDFDEYAVADPAGDVAWFVMSLKRLALVQLGNLHAFDTSVDRFLRAYRSAGPAGATAHLPFYTALQCLNRARRDVLKRKPPIAAWADLMLEEGFRALA